MGKTEMPIARNILLLCGVGVAQARMLTPLLPKHTQATRASQPCAMMVIPGDSVPEALFIDGSLNFIGLYMGVISLRILLSWFPQAQGVSLLQPIFTVSDVYLNLFRGVIPPIAGLDISPIAAFFTLNLLSNSVLTQARMLTPLSPTDANGQGRM